MLWNISYHCWRKKDYAKTVKKTLPEYFIQWLQKQDLSPKELVEFLCRYQNEDCETILREVPCHAAPAQIEDTVLVQTVDLHVYNAFLCCS